MDVREIVGSNVVIARSARLINASCCGVVAAQTVVISSNQSTRAGQNQFPRAMRHGEREMEWVACALKE
jgi:hypothetical protein